MVNSAKNAERQPGEDDPIFDNAEAADGTEQEMFGSGEGRQDDGSTVVAKITMATIGANPSAAKTLSKKVPVAIFTGLATGSKPMKDPKNEMVFFGMTGAFSAVRLSVDGEPEAVFKSDTIFLPIFHQHALDTMESMGHYQFSWLFYAQPAGNIAGYSWSGQNLTKLDRNNLSAIDRLTIHSNTVAQRLMKQSNIGATLLLADMRQPG